MSNTNLPRAKASALILIVTICVPAATRNSAGIHQQYSKYRWYVTSSYLTGTSNEAAPLVVLLHGDAPFVNPGDQSAFASNLSSAVPGTRVFTVFRPGSADHYEAKLGVERAIAFGDLYTLKVVDDMARAIESLKARWNAPGAILVGDEGGAAIAAYLSALHPGLVQSAALIDCPCDTPALTLRRSRYRQKLLSPLAVHSVSPLQALDQMSRNIKVTLIARMEDSMRSKEAARSYVARATALGIPASMVLIPTGGRGTLKDPFLIKDIAQVIGGN